MATKRPKQTEIAGIERKVHKDVRDAAEEYVDARDERMELTEKETATKATLMAAMKKHGLSKYIDEEAEIVVEVVPSDETVKVRKYDPEKEAAKAARAAEKTTKKSAKSNGSAEASP